MRCFGRYNASLWDAVFAELPALTAQDVIIINFGAWYPRFNFNEPRVCLLCHDVMSSRLPCPLVNPVCCFGTWRRCHDP